MSGNRVDHAVELGDLDELVRTVDELVDAGQWSELLRLRDKSRIAVERGKQLWPIASLAEYRLALDAPPEFAAKVLEENTGQFALGPLTEVVGSRMIWDELAPHLTASPSAAVVAHERVLRGEDLRHHDVRDQVLELPLVLSEWEPRYSVVNYLPDRLEHDRPSLPVMADVAFARPARRIADTAVEDALHDLVAPWLEQSNGRRDVAGADGSAEAAIGVLGVPTARIAAVSPAVAFDHLVWAASSGGAHGRRRGGARARFAAWWLLAALTDSIEHWPLDPDHAGELANELQWFLWDTNELETGWRLRLVVTDPVEGRSWAISAVDQS